MSRAEMYLSVDRVGAQGDGIGVLDDGRTAYLPRALPGEIWRVAVTGRAADGGVRCEGLALEEPASSRVDPKCPHFGDCGGCAVQHWDAGLYASWKADKLRAAIRRAGFDPDSVAEPAVSPSHSRRRATFAVRRVKGGVILGFHQSRAERIVDLKTCPILKPEIEQAWPPLRDLLARLIRPGDGARVSVLATMAGLDIVLELGADVDRYGREAASAAAESADIARLSIAIDGGEPEPLVERRPPALDYGGGALIPPPGGFAQATADGEATIAAVTDAALQAAQPRRIADLFAGSGAFGLRAAAYAPTDGYDGDAAAVAAGDRAGRSSGRPYRAIRRDLFKRPLTTGELRRYDVAIVDPPRAGARAQFAAIAANGPPLIIAISCNPATLARDLRMLHAAGYRLRSALPIDQFLWSPHVEAVCVLNR